MAKVRRAKGTGSGGLGGIKKEFIVIGAIAVIAAGIAAWAFLGKRGDAGKDDALAVVMPADIPFEGGKDASVVIAKWTDFQ